MRVTHLSLARSYRGGERQIELLVKALAGMTEEQHAILRCGLLAQRLKDVPGLRVSFANSPFGALRQLGQTDLVHAHDGRSMQTALLARLFTGSAYVGTRRILKPPKSGPLTRLMYRKASALVGVSTPVVKTMIDYGTPRCRLIYDAVDPDFDSVADWPLPLGELKGKFVVGHVGELDDSAKGQRQILEVAAELLWEYPHVHFVLVGQGRDASALSSEAYLLPNVTFAGWQEDLRPWYQAMDLFLFPSRTEALGTALLEAMVSGLPIVATSIGGIAELVRSGEEGELCRAGDTAAMVRAVKRFADSKEKALTFGQRARHRARLFSQERMAKDYEALYAQVLKSPKQQRIGAWL